MEKTNLQVENQNWEEMKAVLNFSSESSDDELSKSYETVISKIISDESPSPEYQLCYVAESGSDSDENCSLFPEVLNVTSQTIIRVKYKEQSALLSNRISCRYRNCPLTFKEVSTWRSIIVESIQKSKFHALPVANLSTIDLVFIDTGKRIVASS